MKYIDSQSLSPYYNLAVEEYILKNFSLDEEFIFLWQNTPTIVVGNNQNTIEEINMKFVKDNNISVVRRMSGGGAVYQDSGNLNFTFFASVSENSRISMKKYAYPIVNALKDMGVPAEVSGRNDITVEGKKVSGNAQRIFKNKILHHGTLLFDSDLDVLEKSLKVGIDKIKSKGIKSIRSRVANISDHMPKKINIQSFQKILLKYLFKGKEPEQYHMSEKDFNEINRLVKEKYATWNWNYGQSPNYTLKNSSRFSGGKFECYLDVQNGIIQNNKIHGDFLSVKDIADIEIELNGKKYERETLADTLSKFDLISYFGSISLEEILSVFFG